MFPNVINWPSLAKAKVNNTPFAHFMSFDFVLAEHLPQIEHDYPKITSPGSFPLSSLDFGDGFTALVEEMCGEHFAHVMGGKFGMTLAEREVMLTVRGQCRPSDGKIHTDSSGKLLTILLYLSDAPEGSDGGRLRLLNSPDNIEDYFAEITPQKGLLLAFACAPNAWHGHKPFAGERRVVQLNWVRDKRYRQREHRRHQLSALLKGISHRLSINKQ